MEIKAIIKKIIKPKNVTYCSIVTSSSKQSLKKNAIVITGGGSGIGKAIATKAVDEGAQVVILGRREEILKRVCEEIGVKNCKYLVYDISESDGNEKLFEEIEGMINHKITALVNNAGIYIDKSITDFTLEDFDKTININLRGPMFMTIGFLKYCKKYSISGNIVMTASNRGIFGDYGPYGVSKRGLIHYVQGLARELIGTGIRVNAVAPGMTSSEINGININGNMYTESARGKRILLPQEIAEVVCFLLSDYSKCINGTIIPCDEGDFLR